MIDKRLRIHGDNIVECERALSFIFAAIGGRIELLDSHLFKPIYLIHTIWLELTIELLPGHGRWGIDIECEIKNRGGILREGADAYISEIKGDTEALLFAIEYCSALPAGNNAWQRNGRAFSSVLAGIPYFYVVELGGVELDGSRNVKAARYPNPIVPFSYLCTTIDYNTICLPVYCPHPSITEELYEKFHQAFGYYECLEIIKRILYNQDYEEIVDGLISKTLGLIEILAADRRKGTVLHPSQWGSYLYCEDRSSWINDNSQLIWRKKISSKVDLSSRFRTMFSELLEMRFESVGAADIPICLVPKERIPDFKEVLHKHYPDLGINLPIDKPIALIWIIGYKPQGDDSRPDRGLCPLAKMILEDSCRYMGFIYGPAKSRTWEILKMGLEYLAMSNGLWQSVYEICDYVLIDSVTKDKPEFMIVEHEVMHHRDRFEIVYHPTDSVEFSEHDIDTAIHQILSRSGMKECLCNPPGGDWSGIDFHDKDCIYRWTSLPRVSKVGGKRPDHVFQKDCGEYNVFISIESKRVGSELENGIGLKLADYLKDLFALVPTSVKDSDTDWRLYNKEVALGNYAIISAGAFLYNNDEELNEHMTRGNLDCVLAFEFGTPSIVHLLYSGNGKIIESIVKNASENICGFEIKIH